MSLFTYAIVEAGRREVRALSRAIAAEHCDLLTIRPVGKASLEQFRAGVSHHIPGRVAPEDELGFGDRRTAQQPQASGSCLGRETTASPVVRTELADRPLYPLTLTIPDFWREDTLVVDNNLPPSEFDDTGFIGRQRDRTNLLRLLTGPHPLVTVTGEGGVGKTALTVRCLYDLVDRRDLFDAIVWTSLKTNHLTVSGAGQIVGAMNTEVDILASVARRFGGHHEGMSVEDLFSTVIEALGTLTVLLVIDNLETIDRAAMRPLFMEIPRRSKVLVTSRVGIGEFEVRYPLQPLDRTDALRLLRTTARALNADSLARRDDGQLHEVADRLFGNPLAIRWFVQSYSEGHSVRDLLDRKRNLEELLQFCFQNLYTTLDEDQVKYLRTLVAMGQPLSEVQLALLANVGDVEKLRASLEYLYASNLILRAPDPAGRADAVLWTTSDFARQYILARDSQVAGDRLRLLPTYRALIQARDEAAQEKSGNPFRSRVIHCSSTDEATVVRSLSDALLLSSRGDHKTALERVDVAARLLPEFYEVWRVSAQVKDAAGDAVGAMTDFERAHDLSDGRADRDALLVFYAQFLAKQEQFALAVEVIRTPATRRDAPVALVATYAWMLTLAGSPKEGAAIFEDVHEELFILSGQGRSVYLTQYAESLRRAGEVEARRGLERDALQYLFRALGLVAEACRHGWGDAYVERQGQRTVREALSVLTRDCEMNDWRQFTALGAELATQFDLLGDDQRALEAFVERWPLVAEGPEFASIFPAFRRTSRADPTPALEGTMKPILYGRTFGFVAGDDCGCSVNLTARAAQ